MGCVGFLDLFSGGALTNVAVFFLGIMPYITASIIMQLLGVVIPKLEQWQQEGQTGQKKITQWTRYLTVALALVQSTAFVFALKRGNGGCSARSASTCPRASKLIPDFTPWKARAHRPHVDRRYRARDVARRADHPARHRQRHVDPDLRVGRVAACRSRARNVLEQSGGIKFAVIIVIAIAHDRRHRHRRVGAAPHPGAVRQTRRRPPHVRRPEHLHPAEGQPVGCDPGDLRELAALVPGADRATCCRGTARKEFISDNFLGRRHDHLDLHRARTALLILFFAYFYTAIAFNPQQQADIIRKQGGFIPGIRPGPPTERYLAKVLNRITLPGGLFIMVIAIAPFLALKVFDIQGFIFGGTSILITVGVMLETMKQIDSQLMMRNYEGFLSADRHAQRATKPRLVLLGKQGAGKGTQANRLADHYGVPHLSTGDMFREQAALGTAFGLEAKRYMDDGELVPDEIVVGVVEECLAPGGPLGDGFVLDGFPRTLHQAQELDRVLDGHPLDVAINLDVPREIVLDRLAGRRVCENCQRVYHVNMPPTHELDLRHVRRQVVQRDDDTEEAIDRRLELYEQRDGADHRLLPRPGACSTWSTASARATRSSTASSRSSNEHACRTDRRASGPAKDAAADRAHARGRQGRRRDARGVRPGRASPGATTADLDAAAREVLDRRHARSNFLGYHGFPAVACISPNEVIVHGIPGDRRLDDGDIVSIDCGAIIEGWHADAAITVPVGEIDDESRG